MRWSRQPRSNPQYGDRRVISKFLWWPKTLNCDTRWMERVKIVQVYWADRYGWGGGWWAPLAFYDQKECFLDDIRYCFGSRQWIKDTRKGHPDHDKAQNDPEVP